MRRDIPARTLLLRAYAVFASGKKDPIDITKGWYDAGDFGKYVNAGATGVSDLFWAYEMFPSQFVDGQFNIPAETVYRTSLTKLAGSLNGC